MFQGLEEKRVVCNMFSLFSPLGLGKIEVILLVVHAKEEFAKPRCNGTVALQTLLCYAFEADAVTCLFLRP
jgi:hypothetical protein